MEINEQNLKILSDENKFKFGYLCIKHVFRRLKCATIQEFQFWGEQKPIEVINLVEKWLKEQNSVSREELESAVSTMRDIANDTAFGAASDNILSAVSDAAWATLDTINAVASVTHDIASASTWTAGAAAWVARVGGEAAAWVAARGKEQRWQEKLLKFLIDSQQTDLNLGKVDEPFNFTRDLVHRLNSGDLTWSSILRSQVIQKLKIFQEFEMCKDYLKSHNFFT